jgi:hypothetical protein
VILSRRIDCRAMFCEPRYIEAVCFVFFLTVVACEVRASIVDVSPGESIQSAIDLSQAGDTILLHDGDYVESVRLSEHGLCIGSRFILDGDSGHIANTMWIADTDVPDSATCIYLEIEPDDTCNVVGLSLTGGSGVFYDNSGVFYHAGGAVFATKGVLIVQNCTFQDGSPDIGGAISAMRQTNTSPNCKVIVVDCRFVNCVCNFWGGGIHTSGVGLDVRNSTFLGCLAGDGGGIASFGNPVNLEACTFSGCQGVTGGVLIGTDNNLSTVSSCLFDGNLNPSSEEDFGTCHLFASGKVVVRGNVFRNNGSNDAAVNMDGNLNWTTPFFSGNVIENHVMQNRVGAMYVFNCGGEISHNIFRNNSGRGGASLSLSQSGSAVRVHHNSFSGNQISNELRELGSCINMNVTFNVYTIDSNQFVGNLGAAIGHDDVYVPTVIRARNNWWGEETGPYHPTLNPGGRGDSVVATMIEIEPWLTSPPDTTLADIAPHPVPEIRSTWELLSVFPNPFNSTLKIELAGFSGADFKLALYDILGREQAALHTGRLYGGMLTFEAPEGLASGVYFLRASDRVAVETRKIVFMK